MSTPTEFTPNKSPNLNTKERMHLLSELQQYKIELETQNEELRCVQIELEKSHNRYFDLYHHAPIGYCTLDLDLHIIDINKVGLEILDSEKQTILNKPITDFVAPNSRLFFNNFSSKITEQNDKLVFEIDMIRPNHEIRHIHMIARISPTTLGQTESIMMTLHDITMEHQVKTQIRHQQDQMNHMARLISMGEMATTLAHELNQPLAAIVHYLGGCIERLKSVEISHEVRHALNRVLRSAERAGAIIQRVRNYSKKGQLDKKPHEINAILQRVLDCQQYELQDYHIELIKNLHSDLPLVAVDSYQIEQVFVIIITNAIEAMQNTPSEKRKLTITTQTLSPNGIEIVFSDQGLGIPKPHLKSIFKPFKSYKRNGMGMGLAIAASIIDAHSGKIHIESEKGMGTQVKLKLAINENLKVVPQQLDVAVTDRSS